MSADNRLGEFLRARRGAITPEDVGLADSGKRRTPGLRREEVAMLAGVSTDYYIRLEQGRERNPSEQVVLALAKALALEPWATAYLRRITGPQPQRVRPKPKNHSVSPNVLRLLEGWTHTPALVMGPWMDVLARNRMARAFHQPLAHQDNILRMTFLDPAAREFYQDFERDARDMVTTLRAMSIEDVQDARLTELVGELCLNSADFRRWWARFDVRPRPRALVRYHHPQVGELSLTYDSFAINAAPGQQLLIYQAEPGSTSEQGLALLGSLAADDQAAEPEPGDLPGISARRSPG
ncbi:transcriptional regulator with XRE-family HTH domain [Crossiella equi]|uniref:Transcriptional regulator with XRE-family HTH domain n=1 Tax=Crossiella equi TaxID=130796 RepID=A0ABS5AML7_9PSEU|nr:helix-turn-helix transcriptional regulator [Crossiella equi]MBP2477497.1 transcriptional regulator with XRE-family HTH domain [Crossiella equi]